MAGLEFARPAETSVQDSCRSMLALAGPRASIIGILRSYLFWTGRTDQPYDLLWSSLPKPILLLKRRP